MAQASDLNIGSLVELNSGGPIMTVVSIRSNSNFSEETHVRCIYFNDENGKFEEATFFPAMLKKVQ